jgi:hypothetical protein
MCELTQNKLEEKIEVKAKRSKHNNVARATQPTWRLPTTKSGTPLHLKAPAMCIVAPATCLFIYFQSLFYIIIIIAEI